MKLLATFATLTALAIATLWVPDEWLIAAYGSDVEALSKATTIRSPKLLAKPAAVKATGFVVAQEPPTIDVAFFDGLENKVKGTLWSSWGDGCLHSNGKYYTSVGDHLGIDANSYVYEYDPATRVLRRVVDVLRAIGHMLGLYGHGKVHSGIHEAADGSLWFSTYWGKHREIDAAFAKGYPGSVVLRFDPKSGKTENVGAIVPKQGLPASHFDGSRQLLYFHSVYKGDIAVFDVKARKTVFQGGADESAASRTFAQDASGRVYFSAKDGALHYFDPEAKALKESSLKLPASPGAKKGDTLRAAAQRPTKDGVVYGMTAAGRFFALDPKAQTVKDLGPNIADGEYTAVMAISPDDRFLYYAPGSHGSNVRVGTPIVQYEIATGTRKVLAFLSDVFADDLKYTVGGTYNLQIAPAGDALYVTFNGANPSPRRETFGRPCVAVVQIPASERK